MLTNQMLQSSVLIKKEIFHKTEGYNPNMNLCEDYDLWLRIGQFTDFYNLSDTCISYMIRENNTTARNQKRMKKISLSLIIQYRKFYP
jgi:predicted glycosyltransferase involved in capsule biosynthesis